MQTIEVLNSSSRGRKKSLHLPPFLFDSAFRMSVDNWVGILTSLCYWLVLLSMRLHSGDWFGNTLDHFTANQTGVMLSIESCAFYILKALEVLLYQQLMVVINAALTCLTSFTVELRVFLVVRYIAVEFSELVGLIHWIIDLAAILRSTNVKFDALGLPLKGSVSN
ncbi:hypothetical protein OUZ56_028036 [Daphnia magna]|uniref:Uncharacterized protein n=1 Tax=Daphnia magna TaxID=35525 RepID=A0ABR0B2N6_9CRUS|nr:hypothetical protein OUZ56_028036 [Daphnia magna]